MTPRASQLAVPRSWPSRVKSAFVHAVSLAHQAVTASRGWCANSRMARVRLAGENDRLRSELALVCEQLRLVSSRMERVPAQHRPHYLPTERLAILELRAARGWRQAEAARAFLVEPQTIASWTRRLDEEGPDALLRTPEPVNRFPDLVTGLVQRLKVMVPSMGRRRIADVLARAGLHLSVSTARRMLKRPMSGRPTPVPPGAHQKQEPQQRSVIARQPGHVWGADLSVMPIVGGLFLPWFPFTLPQCWPFAWWALVIVDHHSRALMHAAVFASQPSARAVCAELTRAVKLNPATGPPKYLITDQGRQFQDQYRAWCRRHGVRPRYGAVGKYGGLAVVERLIRTLKWEGLRRLLLPLSIQAMRGELELIQRWYNEERPHRRFDGATPAEIRDGTLPATKGPRFETRARMPTKQRLRAERGVVVELDVGYVEGRRHLPVVRLKRVA
jgi:transposase InsO family protein